MNMRILRSIVLVPMVSSPKTAEVYCVHTHREMVVVLISGSGGTVVNAFNTVLHRTNDYIELR